MANKKSAKDIAFDKERAKFRHEINEAQHDIRILSKTIEKLSEDISTLEKDNERLSMENNTLRSALDIPVEDLKLLIEEAKHNHELHERILDLFSLGEAIGFVGGNNFRNELNLTIDDSRKFCDRI